MRDDAVHRLAEARDVAALDLLVHGGLVRERAAGAAVFLGDVAQQDAHGAGLVPDLAVDVSLLRPPLVVRHELGLDELADRVAKHHELVRHPRQIAIAHAYLLLAT